MRWEADAKAVGNATCSADARTDVARIATATTAAVTTAAVAMIVVHHFAFDDGIAYNMTGRRDSTVGYPPPGGSLTLLGLASAGGDRSP